MADNTQQSPPVAQQPIETANGNNGRKRRPKPIVLAILAIIIVCGAIVTVRHLQYASCHQSTDNAFLTADVIQISAQVSGTVVSVAVSENQLVKAGDLLVVLDDKTYKANVAQAQANLNAAIAQAKGAGVSVDVMAQTGSAQMQQAEGAVSQAQADIAGADANVAKDSAGIASAQAASSRAAAGISTAQAAVQAAIAAKAGSNDALSSAKSGLDAARSDAERAERDAKRYSKLVKQGAVSEQTADQYASTALSLRSLVDQRAAQVAQAEQQRKVADATIAQAKAELLASQEQFRAAKAGIRQAQAV
ncbi:MAG: biotin/lipoyl-binding protein, partial [Armatimonadota bacterium]